MTCATAYSTKSARVQQDGRLALRERRSQPFPFPKPPSRDTCLFSNQSAADSLVINREARLLGINPESVLPAFRCAVEYNRSHLVAIAPERPAQQCRVRFPFTPAAKGSWVPFRVGI